MDTIYQKNNNILRNNYLKLKNLILEFKLDKINDIIDILNNNKEVTEWIEAFTNLLNCLDLYFELLENLEEGEVNNENIIIKTFTYFKLENNQFVRATNLWYGEPLFTNIAIEMDDGEVANDDGLCYAKVKIMEFEDLKIFLSKKHIIY
jgi:hypothetical protein